MDPTQSAPTGAKRKSKPNEEEETESTRRTKKIGAGDAKDGWAWKPKTDQAKKIEVLREIDQLEKK